jgi:hypothetical protein
VANSSAVLRRRWRSAAALAAAGLTVGCTASHDVALPEVASDPTPAAEAPAGRRLCVALTPAPGEVTIDEAYRVAVSLGMSEPGDINVDWGRVEPEPGELRNPDGELAALNELYAGAASVSLTLAPIQTTYVSVPPDLEGRRWNDPELVARYLGALDRVLAALDDVAVHVVSVGNEVDAFLGTDRAQLTEFAELVRAVNEHLDDRGIQVGSKLTWSGVQAASATEILAASDLAIVSYYPIGSASPDGDPWRARPVSVVAGEIDELIGHITRVRPGMTVFLAEVGYPSDPLLGATEEAQAEFVTAVFDAWDRNVDHIVGMCVVWLFDLSSEVLDFLVAQYGIDNPGFRAYLGSLGLYRADGTPKPAVDVLRRRAVTLDERER